MAKFSKEQERQKMLYAKDLFIKGFDYDTIADIIGIAAVTLKRWGNKNDFEGAKRASIVALSYMRNCILQSFADLMQGIKPLIKPDEASKYASAFANLSDNRKVLTYMYEAFELLSQEFIKDLQEAATPDAKTKALELFRSTRDKMDKVLSVLTSQVINTD